MGAAVGCIPSYPLGLVGAGRPEPAERVLGLVFTIGSSSAAGDLVRIGPDGDIGTSEDARRSG